MDKEYIIQLLQRYFTNQATHTEREALFAEVEKHRNNEEWIELLDTLRPQVEEIRDYNPEHYQSVIDTVLGETGRKGIGNWELGIGRDEGISNRELGMRNTEGTRVSRIWVRWIAAAVIIGIIALAVVGILTNNHKVKPPAVATTHDVSAPTETRAVITLANGSKVYLDSLGTGTIAEESNVDVVKNENGEIIYSHKGTKTQGQLVYNTAFNPRGSRVLPLTLADGTKVWLNSESSLRYPASFASSAVREVEITGEAYFEVKHNAKQPFKVHLPNGSVIEDIGTSFNVNAYSDEEAIKTTLIEGSIRMSPAGGGDLRNSQDRKRPGVDKGVILKPGQQAVLNQANPKITRIEVQTADVDAVLAWKNGLFQFNRASLQDVMREIARWYDVDVSYEGNPEPMQFGGKISRSSNLSEVLKILQLSKVNYKIEGRKITIMK